MTSLGPAQASGVSQCKPWVRRELIRIRSRKVIAIKRLTIFAAALVLSAFPMAKAQEGGPPLTREQVINDPDMPYAGSKHANLTIAEFMDYNCPFCRKTHPEILKLLAQSKHVRVLYKEWPIFGPVSQYAAHLALASKWQGKYLDVHNALMGSPRRLATDEEVRDIAARAGVDMRRLAADMKTHAAEIQAILDRNNMQADAIGLQGTPAFVAGPFLVPGALSLSDLKKLVSAARKGATKTAD